MGESGWRPHGKQGQPGKPRQVAGGGTDDNGQLAYGNVFIRSPNAGDFQIAGRAPGPPF